VVGAAAPASVELADRRRIVLLGEAALRHLDHLAVVGRDVAGRAEQVRLPQPPARHLGRVVLEAEVRPDEVERADAARDDVARGERVHLLLHDQAREQRVQRDRGSVPRRLDE